MEDEWTAFTEDNFEEFANPAVPFDDPWGTTPAIKVPKSFTRRWCPCCCFCYTRGGDYTSYYKVGRMLQAQGRFDEAVTMLKRAININSSFKEGFVLLGTVLAKSERPAEAKMAFEDAIEIDNHYLMAHYSLGMLQYKLKEYKKCIEHFDRCLDIDPSHNDSRRALTAALADLGRPRTAIAHFESAIAKSAHATTMKRVTLKFCNREVENDFLSLRARRSGRGTRVVLLMAMAQQLMLVYPEDLEAGQSALEHSLLVLQGGHGRHQNEPVGGSAQGQDGSKAQLVDFAPAYNWIGTQRAFRDCFLTYQEIAGPHADPAAQIFAAAYLAARGPLGPDCHTHVDEDQPNRCILTGISTDGWSRRPGGEKPSDRTCHLATGQGGLQGNMTWLQSYIYAITSDEHGHDAIFNASSSVQAWEGSNLNGDGSPHSGQTDLEPGPQLDRVEKMEDRLLEHLQRIDHDQTFLILGLCAMALTVACLFCTFHSSFYRWKSLLMTVFITVFLSLQCLDVTFLLIESDLNLVRNAENQDLFQLTLSTELIQTLMTTHIHFALLLAFPQICGICWLTMLGVCVLISMIFATMYYLFQSARLFFPPGYLACVLFFVCVTSFWVEKYERQWFRSDRLLFIQKECVAQYQRDWRKAETRRHHSELEVNAARSALKTRNQMTAFIFHEIRNPLNAMLGAIQMISMTVTSVKVRKWAQIASNSMGMVSNVLNDVLFLSKIEEGKVILHKQPFSVAAMIEEVTFMFTEMAKQKNIEMRCEIHNAAHQTVIGDENRLKEALVNFTTNAIKFTPSGTVTLSVDEVADHGSRIEFDITVTDTGRGLSEANKAKLFIAFQTLRDDAGVSGGPKGTGLVQHLLC
jgi:signal transduction histidine kinase/tetratricopeptide (TPR) repeat protein